jgi:hypothetical protein
MRINITNGEIPYEKHAYAGISTKSKPIINTTRIFGDKESLV